MNTSLTTVGTRAALVAVLLAAAFTSATTTATATATSSDAAAPAAALATVQTFRNGATKACLDDSAEFGPRTYPCEAGNEHQKWNVHQWADGTRELKNVKTGYCLTGSHNGLVSAEICDKEKDESWIVHRYPDGSVELKNQATGLCLDDSFEFHLRTFACGTHSQKSAYQTWS